MRDIDILQMLVDEHAQNYRRDSSYAALNCDVPDLPKEVEDVVLFFIERLMIDSVVNSSKVLRLAAGVMEQITYHRPGF